MNTAEVARALSRVYDPELGIDIVSLGLIYGIDAGDRDVRVLMTMTTAGCPMGAVILEAVEQMLRMTFPEAEVTVDLTFEPAFDVGMASDRAREWLGLPPLRATA